MQLHLHPTRHEALTASSTALTRWSLATNPATILAQMPTAPESVFSCSYSPHGDLLSCGGVTNSPDGVLFAHAHLPPQDPQYWGIIPAIDWRRWDDFHLSRIGSAPYPSSSVNSLACSPDGRWLVAEGAERLFLLEWQTGEVVSHHATEASYTTCLAFDATSTFVAGACYSQGTFFLLWRLDLAERFVPRQPNNRWPQHLAVGQDEVLGSSALSLLQVDWDRLGIDWPNRSLADAPGFVSFSPDSRMVLFSLHSSFPEGEYALVAYAVPRATLLWSVHQEEESTGQPLFSPDGSMVLLPVQGGDLLVYRAEVGALMQRLPTHLGEPVQTLAFDHVGKLWLATEERLVQYQPRD